MDESEGSSTAINQAFLVLSPDSDGRLQRTSPTTLEVAEAHLVARLQTLGPALHRCGIGVEIDDAVRPVFEEFQSQRAHLREALSSQDIRLGASDIRAGLDANGFSRMRILTEEQTRDVGRLAYLRNGANFSVPGAGKTTALLAVHALARSTHPDLRLLVVAPRNAFISWDEEIEKCLESAPGMVRLTGGRDHIAQLLHTEPMIAGITYQQLPLVLPEVEAYMRRNHVHLVLDESHRAKGGRAGVQGAAVLRISPLAVRRDILSGTPMPQGIGDLPPQFDFLWPGMDVCRSFRRAATDSTSVRHANEALRPLFTRTTKDELKLPPLEIIPVGVELGVAQSELYSLLRSEAARVAQGIRHRDRAALRAMGKQVVRLIQVASNPLLLVGAGRSVDPGESEPDIDYLLRSFAESERSAKLVLLEELVDRLMSEESTNKVVVWSTFVANLEYLESRFAEYDAVAIHGSVPTGEDSDPDTREARIRRFNDDPDCRVMVANPAACGEGISLHMACHNAVYLDRSYNAAHFLQSVDRIHRLGLPQGTQTRAWVLMARDTIDESLTSRLEAKVSALGRLLDDQTLMSMVYDPEDDIDDVPAGLDTQDMDSILTHVLGLGADHAPA
ncbi:MAG: DEAD/DEAH box helicase [Coriobacteriia bacterium]|nr:DEAD/DEAH box helicase [Coriobacteriia bacterium]